MSKSLTVFLFVLLFVSPLCASEEEGDGKRVMITKEIYSITVTHNGKPVEVVRQQVRDTPINDFFLATTRGRVQPMLPFKPHAVETIAELEMIDYLQQREAKKDSVLVIDARSAAAHEAGTIPGSTNIYFRNFSKKSTLLEIFEKHFDAFNYDGVWNFDESKILVFFCNGPWCGQSSSAIKKILRAGYPAHKIKYYRGGMQAWEHFGLTVVTP